MLNFLKKNKLSKPIENSIKNNNNIAIPITWGLLTNEQKIKIANIVLKNEKTTIMGCGGDIETAKLIECVEIENKYGKEKYKFLTDDSFYSIVYFPEEEIIKKWLHFTKYGNKDYSKL